MKISKLLPFVLLLFAAPAFAQSPVMQPNVAIALVITLFALFFALIVYVVDKK